MARKSLHNVANQWSAKLNATVNDSVTSFVLKNSGATGAPDVPFKCQVDSERVEVTAISEDTPSAGLDTLTVVREQDGTTAATHFAKARISQKADAFDHQELVDELRALRALVARMAGDPDGTTSAVVATYGSTDLKVVAQGTPDMTVRVQAGAGLAVGQPVALESAYDTSAFSAPSSNPRIDVIQIDQDGNIEIKAGTEAASPSAPSVDADAMKLAEIYHRVGETSIKDSDDASNGYITDSREFT